MAYCTQSDVEQSGVSPRLLIELTDDLNTGNLDAALLARVIEDADAVVDVYLSGVYTVPLAIVPPIIRRCSVDLVTHALYARRDLPADQLTTVRQRYTDALSVLQDLRDRKTNLPVGVERSPSTDPARVTARATVCNPAAIFPLSLRDTMP